MPVLRADVDQIFANLLRNAIEAMPDGGVISVDARMHLPRLLEIRFSDTGPGIEDKIRERIFEPFFTTKDSGQCVGLGLSISREIVENHGGSISVESEPGKGTTFIVRLPIYRGKVLIMDDEKHIRDLTSELLSRSGYSVITAVDGAEAVRLYKQAMDLGQPYDAVVLDLVVPGGMGGKGALKELLRIDPEIKAIACSGYGSNPVIADFEKYGFKGAIIKPYISSKPDEILEEVINRDY